MMPENKIVTDYFWDRKSGRCLDVVACNIRHHKEAFTLPHPEWESYVFDITDDDVTIPELLSKYPGPYHCIYVNAGRLSIETMKTIPFADLECDLVCVNYSDANSVDNVHSHAEIVEYLNGLGMRHYATTPGCVICGR